MVKRNGRKLELAKKIGDFDVVFECVGTEESVAAAINAVRPGGTMVTVGNSINPTIKMSLNKIVLHKIKFIGSVSCTRKEFEETIDLIASGMLDADKYVTDVMKLDDLQHAFERLTSKTDPVVKIVVRP